MRTFEELCQIDDRLLAIYQEAQNPRPCGPDFCKQQLWYATPQANGYVGIKFFLTQISNSNPVVAEHWDLCYHTLHDAIPACKHDENTGCRYDYRAELTETILRRKQKVGFGGLLAQLKAAAEGVYDEYEMEYGADLKCPDDSNEPIYLIRAKNMDEIGNAVHLLSNVDLKLDVRLANGEITKWYAEKAIMVITDETRAGLLALPVLTKEELAERLRGPLSWKPVVVTFDDPEFVRKLSEVCRVVVTVLPREPKQGCGYTQLIYEDVRKALAVRPTEVISTDIDDMPEAVLDGWLGQICRAHMGEFPIAYAWPALIAAASVLVPPSTARSNVYLAMVGEKGTGKTTAFDYAFGLLGITEPTLLKLKSGSAEGFVQRVGDVAGAPRLFFMDEFEHFLLKAAIEGSTFGSVFSSMFNYDKYDFDLARGRKATLNARVTLAGGIVPSKFDELFGAGTEGGFYDRFMFGYHPSKFKYYFTPFQGTSLLDSVSEFDSEEARMLPATRKPVAVTIGPGIYGKDGWSARVQAELKDNRPVEVALRAAVICASLDGRAELRVDDLGPAYAFATYQARIRKLLTTNPGKTAEGILANKFVNYLKLHASDGRWITKRKLFHDTRANDYGPSVAGRALKHLEYNEVIEIGRQGRAEAVRLNTARMD